MVKTRVTRTIFLHYPEDTPGAYIRKYFVHKAPDKSETYNHYTYISRTGFRNKTFSQYDLETPLFVPLD